MSSTVAAKGKCSRERAEWEASQEVAETQMSCGQARCLYIGLLSIQLLRRLGVPERATPREFCAKVGWLRSLRHTVPTSRQIESLELTDDRAANGRLRSLPCCHNLLVPWKHASVYHNWLNDHAAYQGSTLDCVRLQEIAASPYNTNLTISRERFPIFRVQLAAFSAEDLVRHQRSF